MVISNLSDYSHPAPRELGSGAGKRSRALRAQDTGYTGFIQGGSGDKMSYGGGYASGGSRNIDLSRSESDLATTIRKATSIEETAPKRKHVRSCIVYTWDHKSSTSFWAGMKVQPVMADEVQTFKALITIHKVLQEGHPIAVKEAQQNVNWIESLGRGVNGEGLRGKESFGIGYSSIPTKHLC